MMSAELPPQPPKQDPPASPTRATQLPAGTAAGRPRGFTPAAEAAYWIWQGPRGGWRIRTTTKSAQHVFRGRVTPIDTVISSVSPSRTEFRDRIWKSGSSWMFTFKTAGHADGFTFTTRDNGCVKFDLQIDGGPVAQRIVVGKGEVAPPSNHFVVCPHGKKPAVRRRR